MILQNQSSKRKGVTTYAEAHFAVVAFASGRYGAGRHSVLLDGNKLPAGTYLAVLTARQTRLVRRLVILR